MSISSMFHRIMDKIRKKKKKLPFFAPLDEIALDYSHEQLFEVISQRRDSPICNHVLGPQSRQFDVLFK